ncbi:MULTISPECIES: phage tail tube protein [Acinetobacter]|uniref:phage tail tube protein n=1 Tax=Acinetobacter TaxID=469 RepID=UPI000DEAE8A0|nr:MULTISPECIES: phage tail tube protein [Acinetobacter]MDR7015067.1 hypothetical protein [Prolinoborus sp. 3657]MCH7337130.1 hypothetical protein [Acinetobacter sp. NIPH 2699]MCU4387994.1 hypothetical protein [Acinetobacter haemolyticus]RLZ06652.1 hypothetical protein EAH57_15555 [Acinetobacter sp. 2JN-4]WHR57578.1 phage tail tube protein [Acinetobacter haemolyticus]
MARIKVQKTQVFYFDGTAIVPVVCAKTIDLGQDSEEDVDVTCLDSDEVDSDAGQVTPGEGSLAIDFDDENSSHLQLLALSKTDPKQTVHWYLGSSHSTDGPTVTGGAVTLPTTRTWWEFDGYLKRAAPTFEKGQHVGYSFPLKRRSSVQETIRTIGP